MFNNAKKRNNKIVEENIFQYDDLKESKWLALLYLHA